MCEPMDWAQEVEEIERLVQEEVLARHTACQGPTATKDLNGTATPIPNNKSYQSVQKKVVANSKHQPVFNKVPVPNARSENIKTIPTPWVTNPTQTTTKPMGGISYAAAVRTAPLQTSEWTTV